MFKRKKKKIGVQTPEYRKPTPPPKPNPNFGWQPAKSSGTKLSNPPTSGSNVVKPNLNYVPPISTGKPMIRLYGMRSGDLRDWVKTTAQIGDIAYYHDDILDCDYLYCYHGPDDNPFWVAMDPYFLEKHFKKENKGDEKMEGLNPLTMQCTYKTPCGWCTKWDKKCDKKIGGGNDKPQRGLRAKDACINCENKEACKSDVDNFLACWAHNFEYFKAKENNQ